jgi:hypothetical protein
MFMLTAGSDPFGSNGEDGVTVFVTPKTPSEAAAADPVVAVTENA